MSARNSHMGLHLLTQSQPNSTRDFRYSGERGIETAPGQENTFELWGRAKADNMSRAHSGERATQKKETRETARSLSGGTGSTH